MRTRGLEGGDRQKAGGRARGSLLEEEMGQSREGGLVVVVELRCSVFFVLASDRHIREVERNRSLAACRSGEAV